MKVSSHSLVFFILIFTLLFYLQARAAHELEALRAAGAAEAQVVTELLEALGLKPEGDRLVRLGAVGKLVRETQGLGKKLQHKVSKEVERSAA